jgi:hypothetical protein
VLQGIANQCPMEGGAGVFKARILLEELTKENPIYYDNCGDMIARKAQNKDNEELILEDENSNFKLYPNPNNGEFTLAYLVTSENAVLSIYDVMGKLLNKYKLDSEKKLLKINENSLEEGLYFYRVIDSNQEKQFGRFVITK